ncbi:MAG: MBL fold metallo-hydrolase [Hydrogenophilales bacterium]|nr:MBL fold metallo-hydrolase [Hydrogenophilales bacterium]
MSTNLITYDHGIHVLDAEYVRHGLAAIHLMVQSGHAVIVDTGTNRSVPRVMAELAGLGIAPEAVDYVIATHVHLDHAGAAGALLHACPEARMVVHPKGARHMIDPAKLTQGTIAVYGEAPFRELYGEIVACPAERVIEADDGFELDFHGRTLRFIDTPGHARHHFCIHDSASNGIFTGDTFGISYRDFDVDGRPFIFPTSTPVQFEPEALHTSVDRLMALRPDAAYLTHFGKVTGLATLAADLHELIDAYVDLTRAAPGTGAARHAWLKEAIAGLLLKRLRAHGCSLGEPEVRALLVNDIELNAQGLLVWWDRAKQGGGHSAG